LTTPPSALAHQRSIYLAGVAGKRPPVPIDAGALERVAEAFAYIAGGAKPANIDRSWLAPTP